MNKYRVVIKSEGPLMMDPDFGKAESKRLKTLPDEEQAKKKCYHLNDDDRKNLCIPARWIQWCLIGYLTKTAPPKEKKLTNDLVSCSITVEPAEIDLGTREYIVNKSSIPIYVQGVAKNRERVVRPEIKKYKCEFILITTLDKSDRDHKAMLDEAGRCVRMGSGRKIGYGKFSVDKFDKI
jgi:hypothetical protein